MRLPLLLLSLLSCAALAQPRFFRIHVQQRDAGTPIQGARLETTGRIVLTSDVNGEVAFYEPGLMGRRVYFTVTHPAFEHAADGFGYRGQAFDVVEGDGGLIELLPRADGGPFVPSADDEQSRLLDAGVPSAAQHFRLTVNDADTGRGVPLVELRTSRGAWVTDSQGEVAFFDRPSMGQSTTFTVHSHGYVFDADGGALTLTPVAGGHQTLTVSRLNVAERLYRVTGGGIDRDSFVLGLPVPLRRPLLNAGVIGQDSVLSTLYRGQPFFVWGDTNQPGYPLGNFAATAARAQWPDAGGLLASVGIDLHYLQNDAGFVAGVAPIAGPGPVWLDGLTTVRGADGGEELWASYAKVISLGVTAHTGLMRFNDATERFELQLTWDAGLPITLGGHPFTWLHDDGPWVYERGPVRVPARPDALVDPSRYQAFTALTLDGGVQRGADGGLDYAWRSDAPPMSPDSSKRAPLDAGESLWELTADFATGQPLHTHQNDTIAWNAHRQRFVRIVMQVAGASSFLGELWFQEADTPMGPWVWARQVLSHDRTTFYNPRQHPFFDESDGRVIYFEGTYTQSFSNAAEATPRYDYNQVMYRLRLDDLRLNLPVPVYVVPGGTYATKKDLPPGMPPQRPAFLAYERQVPGSIPVARANGPCHPGELSTAAVPYTPPLFFALPPDAGTPPTVPLYECRRGNAISYGTRAANDCDTQTELARVWPNPLNATLPVDEYSAPLKAWAGSDFCVQGLSEDGGYVVSLSSRQSRFRGGQVASSRWTTLGTTLEGPDVTYVLPQGLHEVALEVTGSDGSKANDSVLVEVIPLPLIEAPHSCGCATPGAGVGALLLWGLCRRRSRNVPPP